MSTEYKQYKRGTKIYKLGLSDDNMDTLVGYMEYVKDNGYFEKVGAGEYKYILNGSDIFLFTRYDIKVYFKYIELHFINALSQRIRPTLELKNNEVEDFIEAFINDMI